jgi:hypothetical protein
LIEEAVHLFGGEDGGDAFGELGSGNEARRIFLQVAFADAVFEEGAEGGEFTSNGAFLKTVVVQVADEFADGVVRNGGESGRLEAGRGEIVEELAEVFAVVGNGVRRGVLYGAKIFEIFGDSGLHCVPGTGLLFR